MAKIVQWGLNVAKGPQAQTDLGQSCVLTFQDNLLDLRAKGRVMVGKQGRRFRFCLSLRNSLTKQALQKT